MLPGDFPWSSSGTENGSPTARLHYARRYRTAKARLDRLQEEVDYQSKEVVRAANWVEQHVDACSQTLAAHKELLLRTGASDAAMRSAAGQIAVLERDLKLFSILGTKLADLQDGLN